MKTRQKMRDTVTSKIFFLLACLFLLSCTDESVYKEENDMLLPKEGEIKIRLTLHTPSPQSPVTKSSTTENFINSIHILVMDKNETQTTSTFLYSASVSALEHPDTGTTSFSALLKSSNTPIKIILIANATQTITNNLPNVGDTEEEIKKKLVQAAGNENPILISGYLPMYGEYEFSNLQASTPNTGISVKMLRAIARADIYNQDATGNFTLENVQVFRSYTNIQIIPDRIGQNAAGGPMVNTPSIPDGTSFYPVTAPMPVVPVTGADYLEQLYLPESAAPAVTDQISQATCIIVGGTFTGGGTSQTSYYRIDFKPDGYPFGQVLRNYRYKFNIKQVNSPGWNTPQEAAENAPSGIETTVEAWQEETTDMYFDGEHHYGVSTRNVQLKYRANSKATIEVETDLTGDLLQWCDAQGNPLDPDTPPTTQLISSRFEVTLEEEPDINNVSQKRILFRAVSSNATSDEYSEYMLIHINRWKIKIKITQLPNRNTNETIRILSTKEIGCLGTNATDPFSGISSYGKAMRSILDTHFGSGKTIDIKKIQYTAISSTSPAIDNELTYDVLAQQDVVFLVNNTRPSQATAEQILNWLAARKNRVLILALDWKDSGVNDNTNSGRPEASRTCTNYQVLKLLRNDIRPCWYNGGSNATIGDTGGSRSNMITTFVLNANNEYFWKTGPFTSLNNIDTTYTPINSCTYWIQDIYWGRAEIINPDIIPLIIYQNAVRDDGTGKAPSYTPDGTGDGKMVVGIDKTKRIIYVGDSEIFSMVGVPSGTSAASVAKRNARINNTTGTLNNSYSRIMANLWAWIIEEVVLGDNN